jgi:hypothetical protein
MASAADRTSSPADPPQAPPSQRVATRRDVALACAIVVVGVILRAVQYFDQSSLWLDEAALARNVVDRSFLDLLRPLDYAQVAPVGFLWLERGAVLAFGASELSLRLLPFLASVLTLVLFAVLGNRVLPPPAAALATWLLATAVPMMFFAADVKPYSVDALATVAVALAATAPAGRSRSLRWAIGMGLLGGLAWVSNVVPFVLAGSGIALGMFSAARGSPGVRHLAVMAGLWGALAGPPIGFAIRNVRPDDAAYLHHRWAEALVPHDPRSVAAWTWRTLLDVMGGPGSWELSGALHYGAPVLFVPLVLTGLWWGWRHQRDAALLLLLPAVVTMVASWLGLYPFAGRFVIFLLPSLLVVIAAGTVQISGILHRRWPGVVIAVLVCVVSAQAVAQTPPPQRPEDLRPVLETIARRRQPGDAIYVYYGAGQAFLFYRASMGFERGGYVIGRCARDHPAWLIGEVERLRSAGRVWIVISHAANHMPELRALIAHLTSTGRQLEHVLSPRGHDAEAYLFAVQAVADVDMVQPAESFGPLSWECSGPVTASAERVR